jgi:hypothetical protein
MADPPFNPAAMAGIIAKAAEVQAQAQAAHRAEAVHQLEQIRANACAGAYVADGPAPPVQGALPPPPGFVGEIARFIYQQAPRPVAEVAIVGALGLMAGIAGREWYKPNPDTGLNLYVVLVARSAIGKEAMHTGLAKLITVGAEQYPEARGVADFSDYASGPALIKACSQNPCFVSVAGEIGHKFLAMATDKDVSMRSLRKALTTLYSKSGPDGIAGGIAYSSQENNVESVQGVAFSLIGETTPGTFYESITDAMMRDGFMSRFCVIEYTGDRPDKNSAPVQRPPQALVHHMVLIIRHADMLRRANKFQPVSYGDGALALLDRFESECDVEIRATDDEWRRQMWTRAHLKALRVAALLAVGDNYVAPSVTDEQAAWAINLVRHGIAAFAKRIHSGDVGEGTDGGREQKVLDLCAEFLALPVDKMPPWLKDGEQMRQNLIVPRKYIQQRTARLAAFENHKFGAKAALDLALRAAVDNGNLIEIKKEALVEQYSFFGKAYRLI